jgi:bacterioferritin
MKNEINKDAVISVLNQILEHELSGVVRYTHYSFMVYGHGRIPIVSWLREQSHEALLHAETVGEHITALGSHPSLKIAKLLETEVHTVESILKESKDHETIQLDLYYKLLELVEGSKRVGLEEYAREMIKEEELHISEVEKMLRPSK